MIDRLPPNTSSAQRASWDRLWRVLLSPMEDSGQKEPPSAANTTGAGMRSEADSDESSTSYT